MSLNLGPKDGNFQKYTEQLSSQSKLNQPPKVDPFASTLEQGGAQPQAQSQPQIQAQAHPQAQAQAQAKPIPSWKAAHAARLLRNKLQVDTANTAEQELVSKIKFRHSWLVCLGIWFITWLVLLGVASDGQPAKLLNPIYMGITGIMSLIFTVLVVSFDARAIQKRAREQALEQYRKQHPQNLS